METDQRVREGLGLQWLQNREGCLLSAYGDEDIDEAVKSLGQSQEKLTSACK